MAKNLRVFIDSNIWFSAIYKKGNTSNLLEKLTDKKFKVVISELVLEEIVRNVSKKLPKALPQTDKLLKTYPLTVVKNPPDTQIKQRSGLADKKDTPILGSAIIYKCHYFITGNIKDFKAAKIKKEHGLKVLTAKEALKLL